MKELPDASATQAELGANHSAVLDTWCNERDQAAFGHSDFTTVDHRAIWIAADGEAEAIGHEVFVADINSRSDQPADVDNGCVAEQDAVGVYEQDSTVSGKPPENICVRRALYAVERNRRRRWLLETDDARPGSIENERQSMMALSEFWMTSRSVGDDCTISTVHRK